MRVDEARHQYMSIRRHDRDISIRINGDRTHRYALNDVVSNQHIGGRRKRGTLAVKDADVLKQRCRAAAHQHRWGIAPGAAKSKSCARLAGQSPTRSAAITNDGRSMNFNGISPSQSELTLHSRKHLSVCAGNKVIEDRAQSP